MDDRVSRETAMPPMFGKESLLVPTSMSHSASFRGAFYFGLGDKLNQKAFLKKGVSDASNSQGSKVQEV